MSFTGKAGPPAADPSELKSGAAPGPAGLWARLCAVLTSAGAVTGGEIVAVSLIALGFSLAFCHLIFGNFSTVCLVWDFDFHAEIFWVPFYTVTHFHQFPFWDPYKCGGVPLLADPQSRILTPAFLLDLLTGPTVGIHLEVIARLAIGWAGAYALARAIGINRLGATAAGTAFGSSSWYFAHLGAGHFAFMEYTDLPWVVLLLWISLERRRLIYAAAGGLLMALMFAEGGIYAASHGAVMLAVLAACLAVIRRSIWPLWALAVMGAFTFGFAAVKLLPSAAMVGPSGYLEPFENNPPIGFIVELFRRDQYNGGGFPGGFYGFQEYAAYIGPYAATLLVLGVALRWRKSLPWLITGVAMLALAAGNYGKYSPWVLLHHVPPFGMQHVPTRLLIVFTIMAGVLAGFGVDGLCAKAGRWGVAIAAALIVATAIDGWLVDQPDAHLLFQGDQPALMPFSGFRQLWRDSAFNMYVTAQADMGAINCNEPAFAGPPVVRGYNQPGYRGEQYLLGPGAVALKRWTPNALSYDVDVPKSTVMVVNQNYDPSWRLAEGKGEVFRQGGLLGIRVPAGQQRLELVYRSTRFVIGLAITLIALVAMLLLWDFESGQGRIRAGLRRLR